MINELQEMTFVITGASQGIGETTAYEAAQQGAKVVVSDIEDELGTAVAKKIKAIGGEAIYVHCDVTDTAQVQKLMDKAASTYGGIDVLHNNAGVHESMLTSELSVEDMPLEIWDRIIAINLRGPWLCSKFAVPYLKQSQHNPSIINAGSTGSWVGYPATLAYAPSKGGIAQLTKSLAVDLAKHGIRVNCYCPGSVDTRMVKDYLDAAPDREALLRSMTATHLVPRLGSPQDIANLVCFLASEKASFVNGAVWLIDGGSLAWRGTVDAIGM